MQHPSRRTSVSLMLVVLGTLAAACSSTTPISESAATVATGATTSSTDAPVEQASTAPPTTATPTTVTPTTVLSTTTVMPSTEPSTTQPVAVFELVPAAAPVGTVTRGTMMFDGRERTYRLYVPSVAPSGPVALFIGLHGGTGWGDQFARTNHIEGLAESNGFVVVHPDGVQVAGGPGGVWNGGVCCGIASREGIDDVGFIDALIDQLEREHVIDPTRVFAFGHSNGAIMSYRLGCELSDRIVGIGLYAGTLGVDPCAPARPVSILHVHGAADDNVPIAGGVGGSGISGVDFPSPLAGFDTFAAAEACAAPTSTTVGDITTDRREPCAGGAVVEFVTIATANHAWPGGTPIVTPAYGAGYADYDATAAIVTFLLSHPRT